MANPFTSKQASNYLPMYGGDDYTLEGKNIERSRRLAEAMQAEAMNDDLKGQMVSGIYVAPSWTQGLAKALKGYMANQQMEKADQREAALGKKMDQDLTDSLSNFQKLASPSPEIPAPSDELGGGPGRPAMPGDMNAAVSSLAQSRHPMLRQMYLSQMLKGIEPQKPIVVGRTLMSPDGKIVGVDSTWKDEQQAAREDKKAQADAMREQRMQELQMRLADQQISRQENAALRRELAALTISNRPEKTVTVMGDDGNPVTVPQSQAIGMTPWSPSLAKQKKVESDSKGAKQQLSDVVAQLKGYYTDLKNNGGITSTGNSVLGNIAAKASSSGAGQFVGGAIGTQNQQKRQAIEQTRPLLLNLIKQATGMSAQQMNSNAEMNLYLRTATDPTLTYEANMEALKNLDKMFGLGLNFKDEGGRSSSGKTGGNQGNRKITVDF